MEFGPISVNGISQNVIDVTKNFPPFVQQAVGDVLGQVGNSNILNGLQNLAGRIGVQGPITNFETSQEAPFPKRKFVSFFMLDRSGNLADSSTAQSEYQFKPGYAFNMTVNPKSFKINLPAKTVNSSRTLGGWRLQHWYPEIGSIDANGIIGNMLERFNTNVKDSTAFRGFRRLMKIYQDNGIPYLPNGSNQNRQIAQQRFFPNVVCVYDKIRYMGYFENLDYEENDDAPNTINYSFKFKYLSATDITAIGNETAKGIVASIKPFTVDARIGNVVLPASTVNNVLNSVGQQLQTLPIKLPFSFK